MHTSSMEVLDKGAPQGPSWLEPVPLDYRKKRGFLALGIGAALALALLWLQWHWDRVDEKAMAWLIVCLGVGVWRYREWMQKETVKRYASTVVVLTRKQRLRKVWPLLVLGFGGTAMLLFVQWMSDAQEWSPFVLIFLPFGTVGVLIYAFRKETVLTPEAVPLKARDDADKGGWADRLARTFLSPKFVRYPIAAVLLWFAYTMSQKDSPDWWGVTAVVFWALVAAKEVSVWLLVAGLIVGALVLGFNVIAALPVSVAVIIGALIIAGGMKQK